MNKKLTQKARIQAILHLAKQEVQAIKNKQKHDSIEVNCTRHDILKTMKK